MRLITAVLIFVAWTTATVAEEITFFEKETDKFWSVFGGAEAATGQASCYGRAKKKDGSFVQIHRSLVNGEVWAIIRNTDWEFVTDGNAVLRWNFYRNGNKNSLIDGADFQYEVKNKNTILILQITSKRFTEALWNARYISMIMPGDLSNLSMSFEQRGGSMLEALAECVRLNEKKYKDFKPDLEKVPDSVKERI